ncbi:MAG: AAA family ATPase [Pyrobaculum sp.]|jgi:energy-coupling factor transporter ATP-binding protein EcfA2|uniref:AAA family ATPase n=1 Tax=Pyrobaculum sp. TaxID=2004705 RepID=UPI003CA26A5A
MRTGWIEVSNFKQIENAIVEIDEKGKLLLYGPNGSGKSSLIQAFASLLSHISEDVNAKKVLSRLLPESLQSFIRFGADRAVVSAEIDDKRFRLEIDRRTGVALHVDGERGEARLRLSLSYVAPCSVGNSLVEDLLDVDLCPPGISIRNAEVAEWVRSKLYLLGLEDVYLNVVKERGRWIDMQHLACGFVRVFGLLLAAYGEPDVLIADSFETGLHYDLAVDVIEFLTSLPSFVILESHIGLSVKAALKRGWSVYYVKEGEFVRISNMDELKKIAYAEARAFAEA